MRCLNTFSWYSDCIYDSVFSGSLKNQLRDFFFFFYQVQAQKCHIRLWEFLELRNLLKATEQKARRWFSDLFLPNLFPSLALAWTSQTLSHLLVYCPQWHIGIGWLHDHLKLVLYSCYLMIVYKWFWNS